MSKPKEPLIDWGRLRQGRPIWRFDPYRLGVFIDTAMGTPPVEHFVKALRMALDEGYEQGLLRKEVELVRREVTGLPYCNFAEVREAWRQLVHDEGVIGVAGPWFTENALGLSDIIENDRVPSMSMAVIDEFPGRYRFAWQNGDCAQDAWLMADYAARQGWNNIAVMYEDNNMGREYHAHFVRHARRMRLRLISDQIVPARSGAQLRAMFENAANGGPEAFFYMGNGFEGRQFFQVARETLGGIPKIIGAIFMGCSTPDYGYGYTIDDIEGWIGVDQFDGRNPATIAFLDRYEKRYGERPAHAYVTQGYDWGMVFVEAMSMMRPDTPEALRDALERVRCLPAVTGSAGTTISFAPYDHRAYKGSKWVSLSRCENGKIIKVD